MSARFPSMIGIMRTCVKTATQFCEVPANRLCITTLRILREQGYINGFTFVSPRKKEGRLYPRVRIHFKWSNAITPALKDLKVFKNTFSNFHSILSYKPLQILGTNKLYLLSTTKGLLLTSLGNVYNAKQNSRLPSLKGKLLLEILI